MIDEKVIERTAKTLNTDVATLKAMTDKVLAEQGSAWASAGKSEADAYALALKVAGSKIRNANARLARSGASKMEGMFVSVPRPKEWGKILYNKMKNQLMNASEEVRMTFVDNGTVVLYTDNADGTFTRYAREDFYGEDNSTWPTLCIEPGRILVADTGFILTRVTGLKSSYKEFVGLDAGMETLMRPALYGAFHRVQKVGHFDEDDTTIYDITGRICENTDRISEGYKMPDMKEGELCTIMDSGAYGYSMSHNFNTRPRPSEVLVDNEKVSLIRKRETIEDLFRGCDV